jgi:hypothetical protein
LKRTEPAYVPPKHTDPSIPLPTKKDLDPQSYTVRDVPELHSHLDELRELFGKHPGVPAPVSSVDLKRQYLQGSLARGQLPDKKVASIAGHLHKALHGDAPSMESYIKEQGKALSPEEADGLRTATFILSGIDEATHHLKTETDAGKDWYKSQLHQYIDGIRHIAQTKWGYDPEVFGNPGDPQLSPNMKLYMGLTAALSNGKNPTDNALTAYKVFDLARAANPENPWQALPLKNPTHNKGLWNTAGRQVDAEKAMTYIHNLTLPRNGEDPMEAIRRASDFLTDEHSFNHVREMKDFLHGRPSTTVLPFGKALSYPGSFVFGPKLGAFYQNLIGKDNYLTTDVWWQRTWGRIVGGLFRKGALAGDPDSPHQRDLMDRAARGAASHLGMSVADFQAVMWYYEKELYEAVGSKKTTTSYVEGINRVLQEADPTGRLSEALKASTAARKVGQDALSRKSRPGHQGTDWGSLARKLIA